MAQNSLVVVGIDVAKDKVDACIRSLSQRQTFPNTTQGRRKLTTWLRKHKVDKAVMEASVGYERNWAKALREAGLLVRIVDPKRVRNFARSAGRLAKNDAIDDLGRIGCLTFARHSGGNAETGQPYLFSGSTVHQNIGRLDVFVDGSVLTYLAKSRGHALTPPPAEDKPSIL
jgi:hypothetical protein